MTARAELVTAATGAPIEHLIRVAGADLLADPAGALVWPEHGLLAVADLHFEKGSSLARRGALLPPYDTAATLAVLGRLVARYAPRLVIALGDSFHDTTGAARLADADRGAILALQRGRDWLWITGNHDPDPVDGIGGRFAAEIAVGPLRFRHEPRPTAAMAANAGEIVGHLHPAARIVRRGRSVRRRCFVTDGMRLVMPALGAYTGGLNIRDRAFSRLFGDGATTAHLLGETRLYAFGGHRCLPD